MKVEESVIRRLPLLLLDAGGWEDGDVLRGSLGGLRSSTSLSSGSVALRSRASLSSTGLCGTTLTSVGLASVGLTGIGLASTRLSSASSLSTTSLGASRIVGNRGPGRLRITERDSGLLGPHIASTLGTIVASVASIATVALASVVATVADTESVGTLVVAGVDGDILDVLRRDYVPLVFDCTNDRWTQNTYSGWCW
jgi:hypothetical protein